MARRRYGLYKLWPIRVVYLPGDEIEEDVGPEDGVNDPLDKLPRIAHVVPCVK